MNNKIKFKQYMYRKNACTSIRTSIKFSALKNLTEVIKFDVNDYIRRMLFIKRLHNKAHLPKEQFLKETELRKYLNFL